MSEQKRPPIDITRFDFQGKVFTLPGARFGLFGPRQEPRFFVTLGDMEASLDLKALAAEFGVAQGGADDQLIKLIAKSLKFVSDIRPGDAIPSEILNGTASWSVAPRHREMAERRLQVQLLSWVSGKEVVLTDDDELKLFLDQIENKAKLRQAFEMAAEALGRARTDHEHVLYLIGSLARELCYIEALRERFTALAAIPRRLVALRAPYSGETRTREEVHRVTLLMGQAMATYTKKFEDVDAQTGEIIGALKSFERQIEFIRDTRDELFFAFREWDVLISRWSTAEMKKSRATDSLISDTYRLLASRFAASRSMLKAA
jgi:hypothetical protein